MSEVATAGLLLVVFATVAAAGYGTVRVVWLVCESLAGWWHDRRGCRDLRRRGGADVDGQGAQVREMAMTDPCPKCGGPMTQVTAWGQPRRDLGAFCETCTPASATAILPPEYRTAVASSLDAAFTDLFADVEFTVPAPPSGEEILASIRRLTEPSMTVFVPPDDVDRVRRAVGDEGLGLAVRVVGSEFVEEGQAVAINHGQHLDL